MKRQAGIKKNKTSTVRVKTSEFEKRKKKASKVGRKGGKVGVMEKKKRRILSRRIS